MRDIIIYMRLAALGFIAALLAACQTGPSESAWLMNGDSPYVGPDGQCVQVRPLTPKDKSGFCYQVMNQDYQKQHHYEPMQQDEFAFLFPHIEPTADQAQVPAVVTLA